MKVHIKDLGIPMDLGSNGVEFGVYTPDGKKHLGDLRIGKATITWSPGRASKSVIPKSWADLVDWFEESKA